MSTCRDCAHLVSDKAMSPHGFNGCAKSRPWKFFPLGHSCKAWEQGEEKALAKRFEWFRKKGLEKS